MSADADPWPERMPLRRALPPPEPFPLDLLGPVLGAGARAIIQATQCPPALAGQSVLAAAALAVQAHADVAVDGRVIPLSVFAVTVAESGERKSAVDRLACRPHHEWQRDRRAEQAEEHKRWKVRHTAWKRLQTSTTASKDRDLRQVENALRELGDEPEPPLEAVLCTEEPTYEGLVKLLGGGWPTVGLFSDEGGRFLGGHAMSPEKWLMTAAGLSKLWDGDPITRTRAGDGNMVLYGRRLSLHLMVQPSLLSRLYGSSELIGQGLLSRILPSYPVSTIGSRQYQETDATGLPAFIEYEARLREMLNRDLPLRAETRNELAPRSLSPTEQAKREYVQFHDHVEGLSAEGQEFSSIRGFASKLPEHAVRIAGVLALVRDPETGAVRVEEMCAGIVLAQHYAGEVLRLVEAATDNPDLVLAEKVLHWARVRGGQFATETLYQLGPNAIRSKAKAERILQLLEDHGEARPLPPGTVIDEKKRRNAWEVRPE